MTRESGQYFTRSGASWHVCDWYAEWEDAELNGGWTDIWRDGQPAGDVNDDFFDEIDKRRLDRDEMQKREDEISNLVMLLRRTLKYVPPDKMLYDQIEGYLDSIGKPSTITRGEKD